LETLGYDLVIFCVASTYVIAKAVTKLMRELKRTGTTVGMLDDMIPFDEFNKLVGLNDIREKERKYATGRN